MFFLVLFFLVLVLVWGVSDESIFVSFFGFDFGLGVSDESIFVIFLVLILVWGSLMSQLSLVFWVLFFLVLVWGSLMSRSSCF